MTVATAGGESQVRLWDASDGRLLPRSPVTAAITWSLLSLLPPNGRVLASGGHDNTIKIWDPHSGNLVRTLEGHADTVRSVSFLADGRLLASKGRDGSLRLWDCGAWTPAGVIAEPGKGAWSPRLAFHPGRPLLARAGSDEGDGRRRCRPHLAP